jgi:hypothetical protein
MKLSHRLGWPKVPGKFTLVDEDHQSCAGAFTARKRGAARSCCLGPSYRLLRKAGMPEE